MEIILKGTMMKKILLSMIILAVLGLSSCQAKTETIKINDPWARPGISGNNSAAYMTIVNGTDMDDKLLAAECDCAEKVELHESMMNMDGKMMMMEQENIPVPAGKSAELKPGGLHIMLIGLKQDLKAGETLDLSLTFEKAGTITIQVPVQES